MYMVFLLCSLTSEMASFSPEKSNSANATQQKDIEGYVHQVSDIKIPANPSSSRYFDFTLQEADQETRVVCFSPNKRDELKEKEKSKFPVHMSNTSPQKRRFAEGVEYRINKFSKLSPAKNLSFQWRQPTNSQSSQTCTIKEILDTKGNGDLVAIKAKVLSKSESVYSHFMNKQLNKCDVVVADAIAAITVTLWEMQIDQVSTENSFYFQALKVNYYNTKHLNSNKSTKIDTCDDVALSKESTGAADDLKPKEKAITTITGTVFATDVKKSFICINCKSKIADMSDKTALKCTNCSLKMKKTE